MNAFLKETEKMLKHFPDHRGLNNIEKIREKSQVLHLGLDLARFDKVGVNAENNIPLILWNHRWEFDKNPAEFFNALYILADRGLDFEVAVLGENFSNSPTEFETAKEKLENRILQFGYADSFETYTKWLKKADIVPVTSNQDFFGASAVEAIYCGCYPLLPKRLSFPEVLPIEKFPENFYSDFDDLVEKLEMSIKNLDHIRQQNLKYSVEKYSWTIMSKVYDDAFENCAKRKQ